MFVLIIVLEQNKSCPQETFLATTFNIVITEGWGERTSSVPFRSCWDLCGVSRVGARPLQASATAGVLWQKQIWDPSIIGPWERWATAFPTYFPIADNTYFSRTQFKYILTEQLMSSENIHSNSIIFFLKSILIHPLQHKLRRMKSVRENMLNYFLNKACFNILMQNLKLF